MMIKYGIPAVILFLIALSVTAVFRDGGETGELVSTGQVAESIGQGDMEQRLESLELALLEERRMRMQLESRVAALLEQSRTADDRQGSAQDSRDNSAEGSVSLGPDNLQAQREAILERRARLATDPTQRQVDRLVEAGFEEYRAAEIVRISEQYQMQMLNAQYAASRGEPYDADLESQLAEQFKSDLGEADYEKYLLANRQPTSVVVANVLESSPAQAMGLQNGDQIISYDGKRVYNIIELNRLTQETRASGSVRVEVLRDGQPLSFSLPPGPMGISSSSRPGMRVSERGF